MSYPALLLISAYFLKKTRDDELKDEMGELSREWLGQQVDRYRAVASSYKGRKDLSIREFLECRNAHNRAQIFDDQVQTGIFEETRKYLMSQPAVYQPDYVHLSAAARALSKDTDGIGGGAWAALGSYLGTGAASAMISVFSAVTLGSTGANPSWALGIGAAAGLAFGSYAVATRLLGVTNNSEGYSKVVQQLRDPARSGLDLSKETLAFARGECWVVSHPGASEPSILTMDEYRKYRKRMRNEDIPLVEVSHGTRNIHVRRTVGGKLQSTADMPAVATFSRKGELRKEQWFEKGSRKDEAFFRSKALIDSPFLNVSVRPSDGQMTVDALAPVRGKMERRSLVLDGSEAAALMSRISRSSGPAEVEATVARHLGGIPAPSEWLESYDPRRGNARLESGDITISVSRAAGGQSGWRLDASGLEDQSATTPSSLHLRSSSQVIGLVQQLSQKDPRLEMDNQWSSGPEQSLRM